MRMQPVLVLSEAVLVLLLELDFYKGQLMKTKLQKKIRVRVGLRARVGR
jgi:hypothetical protein